MFVDPNSFLELLETVPLLLLLLSPDNDPSWL
jgi:hypothetical protein